MSSGLGGLGASSELLSSSLALRMVRVVILVSEMMVAAPEYCICVLASGFASAEKRRIGTRSPHAANVLRRVLRDMLKDTLTIGVLERLLARDCCTVRKERLARVQALKTGGSLLSTQEKREAQIQNEGVLQSILP